MLYWNIMLFSYLNI